MSDKGRKIIEPGIWYSEFDEKGNCIKSVYEDSFKRLLGFDSDKHIADNSLDGWTNQIHPDDVDKVNAAIEQALDKNKKLLHFDAEYRMMTKNGYHLFHDYGICTRRADGSLARCDGLAFDLQSSIDSIEAHEALIENNQSVLALEDDFESLYDVNLKTGEYECYVKGDFFKNNNLETLVASPSNIIALSQHIKTAIYKEDLETLFNTLAKETIAKELKTKNRHECLFRINTKKGPIWFKTRIVYKNEEKKNIIVGLFNAEEEVAHKEKAEIKKQNLLGNIAGNDGVFIIDCIRDTRTTINNAKKTAAKSFKDNEPASVLMKKYIDNYVFEEDKEMMREYTNISYMLERVNKEKEYSFKFRDISEGIPKYFEVRILKYSDTEVLTYYRDCDNEILHRLVSEKIITDFASVFIVDIDNDSYRFVSRNDESGFKDVPGGVYTDTINEYISRVNPDYRQEWYGVADLNNLRKLLKKEERLEYVYPLEGIEKRWRRCIIQRLESKNGVPKSFVMTYFVIDDERAANLELSSQVDEQKKQTEQALVFTNFFLGTYVSAYYVNLDTLSCQIYKRTDDLKKRYPIISNYYESMVEFINKDVFEEDRDALFKIVKPETMKKYLKKKPEYEQIFREAVNGEIKYYKLQVIRGEDESHAAFGFINVDKIIREQQKHALGTVPLSPDVLTKANVGLWAFELDEGKAPRMYGDETMIKLVGLDHQVAPEEMYHAWYDHIDSGSYDLVAEAVDKMMVGHAEVQYPWHHPNGTTMIVRCGGVRNPEYTKGIRIEGTHQDVSEVLHYDEEEINRLKESVIKLEHERLRSEVLNFMIDNDDDPIELLKNYAERLRVLINCDQVIYRDLEETRIMVNSPAIEKTWSVPFEYCQQCQHLDAHHPMYAGGYTEMDNCQEGWQGIPVYEKCPIKSSLTRIVYCDGEIAGYLAIHYVQNYHHFTDIERSTLEEFTRILSISLSRYESRKKSLQLEGTKKTLDMVLTLSYFDPIMIVDPETGEYDWLMSVADDVVQNTSMTMHGEDLYKNIGIDAASIIHEDDRAQFQAFYTKENMMKIAKTGEVQEIENRWFISTEGRYKWKYNKAARMFDDNGKPFIIIGVIDNTEEKEKEEEFIAQRRKIDEQQVQLVEALHEANEEKQRNDMLHDIIHSGKWSFFVNANDEIVRSEYSEEAQNIVGNHLSAEVNDWLQIVHPDDLEATITAFTATIKDHTCKTPYDVTYRMADAKGEYHWFHSAGRIFREEDGSGEFFGIHIDITNQIESQLASQRELEKNMEIIEALASDYSSVYYVDIDSEIVIPYSMNEETQKGMAGIFEKGTPFPEAFKSYVKKFVYESDREMILKEGRKKVVLDKLKNNDSYSITFRGLNNGEVSFCEMKYVVAHKEGDEIKSVALGFAYKDKEIMAQYINEKLAAEYISAFLVDLDNNKYRIYRYPDSTSVMDREDRIWSLAMADFAKECEPEYFEIVKNIGDPEYLKNELKDVDRREYQYRYPSETQPWRRAVVQVIDRKGGAPSTIVVTFMRIDDYQSKIFDQQKQLEVQQKQLEEALSMAQSANRAKTTFLNNMSHDIRTPMNAIIGYTGLAASHIDNKEQVQDYLSKIGQSSNHLLSLINDVLDMSRIESGKMNLDEKEENLSEIIHTLRDIVQADIHSKQLDFFVDAVDVNDENIVCDKLRLNQVLLNVLSNSIKYTPAGGTITMRVAEKTIKKSGYAAYNFVIKDNGMGMDAEFLKTIFDPFTRVKSSTVSGIQGTGLGMAITKNIIDMMGGIIDVKSEPNKGTETTITFEFKLQSAPNEPTVIPQLDGVRGLVVDDDSNTCMSISNMLRDVGMRPEWCTSGKEAVIRAKEGYHIGDVFKVYIIDWLMPDMNGIETTRRIRKAIGDDAPIIILTAYDWSDIEDEAREAGVTAFVSKPMFPSDLHRVLNNCLGNKDKDETVDIQNYDFTGKKILLVEDNMLNREIATEILTEDGFIIDTAEDGDIAVERMKNAKTGDYDIVLMDVQMPTMNGYEATKLIRALGTPISKIPIIAMTANAFEEDRKLAIDSGMDEHIAKPIDVDKLKETLAKFL